LQLIFKKNFFLIFFFIFFFCNNLKADEVLYNGTCINGGGLKADTATLDELLKKGFDLAKIYNFNLTFNQKDLKYCNLQEKYLTNNPFTGDKLKNKIPVLYLTFTPTPYNPNYMPQYISYSIGGATLPASCSLYLITDIKKNNNDKSIQIIINNNNFKHSKDIAGGRETICK
jgi:hypothetical protein